jgi:hypothetical protein
MDQFYFIVLTIALVFLILVLTFFGILMGRKNMTVYPPTAANCPDGWSLASDGSNCRLPSIGSVNTGVVGAIYGSNGMVSNTFISSTPGLSLATNSSKIKFTDPAWSGGIYSGLNTTCAHKKWASQFGINWDGVSNYNSC